MNPHIFRAYDVRGIVGPDVNEDVARLLGRGYGTYVRRVLGGASVVVGHDNRASSPALSAALVDGLRAVGCAVSFVGLVPTPGLYYAVYHLAATGGVMVTASHNPVQYNGFKLCKGHFTLADAEIAAVRDLVVAGDFASGHDGYAEVDIMPTYLGAIKAAVRVSRPLKVVVDAGNAVAGAFAPQLLRDLGMQVVEMYCDLDPTFPHHLPDPQMPENVADLRRRVVAERADLGLAYDGDADRVGVVDERGKQISADMLMVLFARQVLASHPGATVIFDVKCTQFLADDVRARGGVPLMWKTGHSLIKEKMREVGALLAGEQSGHVFFGDRWPGFDDGIYASCRALEIATATDRPFSTLLADAPPLVASPEIRVACADERKFAVVDAVRDAFAAHYEVNAIDGARVNFGDGWGLIRASNTGPALTLRFEAQSDGRLRAIERLFRDALAPFPEVRFDEPAGH
ncbi:MAG: phosphomannomutase/phosphoglucomutase [Chloroflexi bacterium]|nr:phosphomannomutase/phosphoglucomutase [Chloroflexota bacterium]